MENLGFIRINQSIGSLIYTFRESSCVPGIVLDFARDSKKTCSSDAEFSRRKEEITQKQE